MIERRVILRLRRQMPFMQRYVCMNWGHSGPSPRPILKAIQEMLEQESRYGPSHPEMKASRDALLDRTRRLLGEVIGAGADEITLTDNTTAGINLVAHCLDWKRGDEVIISNTEHPGGYLAWFALRDRWGIKIHQIHVDGDDDHFLKDLAKRINHKTRLICISHVAWLSGYRYPLREVAKVAKSRGVFFLVDGAQAAGALDFNVRTLGCEFYAYPGQKWLMGPLGTGALYVRRDLRKKLPLPGAGTDSAPQKDLAAGTYTPYPDGRRFELGTKSTALFAGLSVGAEQTLRLGLAAIEERVLSLAGRLLDRLQEISHLEILSFRPAGRNPAHSGLVSFRIPGIPAADVVSTLLRRERTLVREVPADPPGIRVSLHYLNLEEEVDGLATAVGRLAARKAGSKT